MTELAGGMCTCRKLIYLSRAEAQRVIAGGKRTGYLEPYQCPCDSRIWHLTHHRRGRVKGRRARRLAGIR